MLNRVICWVRPLPLSNYPVAVVSYTTCSSTGPASLAALPHNIEARITLTLTFVGLVVGVFVSMGALTGDTQGRVNLLFLLLLFAFLPAFSLLMSLFMFLFKGNGLTGAVISIPVWPKEYLRYQVKLGLSGQRQRWLFYQSQVLSLAFAIGGIIVFFTLLLGTDVNFVWRSTLLEATDLQPWLKFISTPWFFWSDAQPSLELLQQSQDSRIENEASAYSGNWWQFVLAAQLSYNLLPRTLLLVVARWQLGNPGLDSSETSLSPASTSSANASTQAPVTRASIVYTLPKAYDLLEWGHAPEHCKRFITQSFGKPANQLNLDPLTSKDALAKVHGEACLVVLVKSWEPPLGELKDILADMGRQQTSFILPMDWDEVTVKPAPASHLMEWQRFAATLGDWQILQPGEHS